MLKIVHIPHQVLTSPTQPVVAFDKALKKLVIDMEETLIAQVDPQGVGLAATQIGKSMALFIMKPSLDVETQVFVNPTVLELDWKKPARRSTSKKKEKDEPLEGCLSIPRIWSPVKRAQKVHLQYQDVTGKQFKKWFKNFEAIIVQHEVDHLNGILFTQRALEQNATLFEEKNGELKKIETVL